MRPIWAVVVALVLALMCDRAESLLLGGGSAPQAVTSCPANDGSSGAPVATIQYPTLLNSYAATIHALGCNVAGVDYAVGVPTAASLTDWRTLSGTGITVNTGTKIVTITGQTGATIANVDFSLANGAILNVVSSPNLTVNNCNFGGTNYQSLGNAVIIADGSSGGLTLTNSIMDGAGAGTASALINSTVGGVTLQYNYFKNFPQQVLSVGNSSGTIVYKYNLIENGGQQSGAHLNYMQLGNGTYAITVQFNTTKQSPQAGGAGEGFQFYAGVTGQATLTSPSFRYNTMIATGVSAMSYMVHGNCHASGDCASTGSTVTSGVFQNNYADITGALGLAYPSSGSNMWQNWTLLNNINMTTGAAFSNSP